MIGWPFNVAVPTKAIVGELIKVFPVVIFNPDPVIAPCWSTLINEVAPFDTLNAFPVEDTEAEILESEILFVDTVADVKMLAPFRVAVPFKAVTPPALTVKLLTVAVPLTFKLVPTVVPPFKVAPFATISPLLRVAVDPLTVNP